MMDSPKFDPWTTEEWFDDEGKLHTRDLYLAQVRLKRGSMGPFIEKFRGVAAQQPFYLEFYSPAGMTMTAEVRALTMPEEQKDAYDIINFLVALSPDQVLALFPCDETADFGY